MNFMSSHYHQSAQFLFQCFYFTLVHLIYILFLIILQVMLSKSKGLELFSIDYFLISLYTTDVSYLVINSSSSSFAQHNILTLQLYQSYSCVFFHYVPFHGNLYMTLNLYLLIRCWTFG